MTEVSLDTIETTTATALRNHGAAPWVAAHVAHAVRVAEATGNVICGLYYVESYCTQLKSGRVQGDVEPVVTRPRAGIVDVDARMGFAQPTFARGLPEALEAAREVGTLTPAIRPRGRSRWCACIRAVSPVTSSARSAASAVPSYRRRWLASPTTRKAVS